MNHISFHHWVIAFLGAMLCHAAVAFSWWEPEPPKMERSAGAPVQIVGALSNFAHTKMVEETVEDVTEPIEEIKTPDILEPVEEPQADAIDVEKKKVTKKKKKKKTAKEHKKKKAKKAKKRQKKQRANKRVAALQKGGGAKGRKKAAGRTVIANYRGRVQSHLSRYKRSPGGGRRGRTVVSFTILRSGGVTGIRLVRSSGNQAIDRATLSMVRRASPFPAIPAGGPNRMRFSVPVSYR